MDLRELTCEHFTSLVNTKCRILGDAGAIDVEVSAARKLGAGRKGRRDPFSVVFLGPPQFVLPQGIYQVEAGELGTLGLFLVTIGPDEDGRGMQYEAVFT